MTVRIDPLPFRRPGRRLLVGGGAASPVGGGAASPVGGGAASPVGGGAASPVGGGAASPVGGGAASPVVGGGAGPPVPSVVAATEASIAWNRLRRSGMNASCCLFQDPCQISGPSQVSTHAKYGAYLTGIRQVSPRGRAPLSG
ncbi:hypothetical protein [Actinoplanes teichomyceticus]|uniref:hypothetical protein n=1 Tax=Actinoplanes teichomyceticus TaxID=1867 RepID=UPI001656833F|nr:hypothetical protein [Actinoplanes teichomyceticus]